MKKILVIAVLLLLSAPMVNAELPDKLSTKSMSLMESSAYNEVDVNYFGELITLWGHEDDLAYVDWSPDGTKIVSSDWLNGIKIWNSSDGTLLNNLTGHSSAVWTVKWSPDGTKIASASWDKTVRVWDALTGEELAVYNHTGQTWGLDWSPDGKNILSGGANGELTLWNVSTGNSTMSLTTNTTNPGSIVAIEWSPDGTKIATGSWGRYWDNTIIIWNASTYEIIGSYVSVSNPIFYNPGVRSTDVEAISWSPDSARVALGTDSGLTIIKILDGSRIEAVILDTAWGVSWSPDGTKIATAMQHDLILIWDINGNIIRKLTGHVYAETVSWSPDGTRLASGADDDSVIIWGDLRDVISEQQNTLNNISSDVTRFEQAMQTTFDNPDFTLAGSTPDEKVKTLVDVLVQLSRGAKNEIYKVLGYK